MDRAYYHEIAALEDRHWWFEARRQILKSVLDRLSLPPGATVLEIGCGTGGNLGLLSGYGRLYACEPDAEACILAAAQGPAEVARGGLPDTLPFGTQTFDLIAMLDVLEHVEADAESLRAVYDRLKPGGVLLMTVPAYMFLWSAHDVVNHHFRRYARPEVVTRLREARFEVRHATYFNTVLFPVVAAARMLGKLRGRDGGSDLSMPSAPMNGLLRRIFAAERHLVPSRSLPFGVSILAVGIRPLQR